MKIALLGYGKMGRTIEELARRAGDEVVLRIRQDNRAELTADSLRKADVAIEFSRPEAAFHNVEAALQAGVPVVCGTTGWLDQLPEAKRLAEDSGTALFYAANYSIGVNLFFAVNRYLARLMDDQPKYDVHISEIHHTQKLDSPSGTAIHLAQDILQELQRKTRWEEAEDGPADHLLIHSERIDPTPGTHVVTWGSPEDDIVLQHRAHSRDGFARGALQAARWLVGKKGYFSMQDMLGL